MTDQQVSTRRKLNERTRNRLRTYNILQCPIAPHLLTPDLIYLALCEAFRLYSRIIAEAIVFSDLFARYRFRLLAICSFVYSHNDRAA